MSFTVHSSLTAASTGDRVRGQPLGAVKTRSKPQKPFMYKVILLNDDYTPMEFVIALVQEVFRKSAEEAVHITLSVHHHGSAVCGVYSREVAEAKVMQVIQTAERAQHPLMCKMEKE